MSYYSELKKERIRKIVEHLKEENGQELDKLVAEITVQYGLSESKAREYIEQLRAAGKIQEDEDGIINPV